MSPEGTFQLLHYISKATESPRDGMFIETDLYPLRTLKGWHVQNATNLFHANPFEKIFVAVFYIVFM